ncbi:hypothetical protein B0H13DRAFT_1907935 [Mycena leptocephala]|nr:hypothetical protein B0H13DRAFT_1907935 [Mycena leptocephala]
MIHDLNTRLSWLGPDQHERPSLFRASTWMKGMTNNHSGISNSRNDVSTGSKADAIVIRGKQDDTSKKRKKPESETTSTVKKLSCTDEGPRQKGIFNDVLQVRYIVRPSRKDQIDSASKIIRKKTGSRNKRAAVRFDTDPWNVLPPGPYSYTSVLDKTTNPSNRSVMFVQEISAVSPGIWTGHDKIEEDILLLMGQKIRAWSVSESARCRGKLRAAVHHAVDIQIVSLLAVALRVH